MLLEDVAVVEPVDVVGGEDEEHVGVEGRDLLPGTVERVRVSAIPAALVVADVGVEGAKAAVRPVEVPGPATREMRGERVRLVLLEHPDVPDPAVVAVGEREVDEPVDAGERQRRLRALRRQDLEAAAFTARKHEREDFGAGAAHGGIMGTLGPCPGP